MFTDVERLLSQSPLALEIDFRLVNNARTSQESCVKYGLYETVDRAGSRTLREPWRGDCR